MNEIENDLKAKLQAQPLQVPSLELDSRIEDLINSTETINDKQGESGWKNWSIAASLFAVVMIGVLVNFQNDKDPLQLAFEESFRLEHQVKEAKPKVLQPVFFLEESKINQEITELDRQLQLLLLLDDNDEEVLELMNKRVLKLNLLQQLYEDNQPVYRI